MNKATYISTSFSPLIPPRFNGIAEPKIKYKHDIKRLPNSTLKIEITVYFSIKEFTTSKIFDVVNATSVFSIKIEGDLTIEDLYPLFAQAFMQFREGYRIYEIKENHKQIKIQFDSLPIMKEYLSGIVAWFYSP